MVIVCKLNIKFRNMAKILPCLILGFLYVSSTRAELQKSHFGKQFYIGMISARTWTPDFQIDIASKEKGNVYLDIPYLNVRRNESLPKGGTTLTVSNSLIRGGTFTENRGIYLSTDVPVAVYVTWKPYTSVMDTYLALPLSSLGTRYTLASYDPWSISSSDRSEMMVVGANDNTTVTITDRMNNNATLSLNTLDVHQLSNQTDISNTIVKSDKPVTIISGTPCAFVPYGSRDCGMLLEQMIPSCTWENSYIIPPVFPKLGFVLKVFAVNNAAFCLKNSSETICSQLHKEEYLMGTEPVVITSNDSISVVQYGFSQGYDNIRGDAFMTVNPGIRNYLNNYYFVVPSIYSSLTNRLSIVVPSKDEQGLRLDGSPLVSAKSYSVPEPFSNYSVLIINITVGYHELTHIDTSVRFGVTAYGLGSQVGYGFPVGFGFQSENSLTSTAYSPTPTSAALTTSGVNLPQFNISTTGPMQISYNATCYSCDDLSYVELCDVVKHCGVNEVCYLKSYVKFGRKLYRSGCMQSNMCLQEMDSYQHLPDKCVECCSEHYCNHKGCGDNGLVPRNQRGPLCYDCSYERSPADCNKLTLCGQNECSRSSRSVHVATRALPVCRSCCSDDYCNHNCTGSDVGSILVG